MRGRWHKKGAALCVSWEERLQKKTREAFCLFYFTARSYGVGIMTAANVSSTSSKR
jgi:hypothetical protein